MNVSSYMIAGRKVGKETEITVNLFANLFHLNIYFGLSWRWICLIQVENLLYLRNFYFEKKNKKREGKGNKQAVEQSKESKLICSSFAAEITAHTRSLSEASSRSCHLHCQGSLSLWPQLNLPKNRQLLHGDMRPWSMHCLIAICAPASPLRLCRAPHHADSPCTVGTTLA